MFDKCNRRGNVKRLIDYAVFRRGDQIHLKVNSTDLRDRERKAYPRKVLVIRINPSQEHPMREGSIEGIAPPIHYTTGFHPKLVLETCLLE